MNGMNAMPPGAPPMPGDPNMTTLLLLMVLCPNLFNSPQGENPLMTALLLSTLTGGRL